MSARELAEGLEKALPILDGLETGQDCADYAFARGNGFQAMTYCPEAFEALRVLPEVLAALRRVEALEAENARLREAFERLRDCDWVISLPDRMDAVREIARNAFNGRSNPDAE